MLVASKDSGLAPPALFSDDREAVQTMVLEVPNLLLVSLGEIWQELTDSMVVSILDLAFVAAGLLIFWVDHGAMAILSPGFEVAIRLLLMRHKCTHAHRLASHEIAAEFFSVLAVEKAQAMWLTVFEIASVANRIEF